MKNNWINHHFKVQEIPVTEVNNKILLGVVDHIIRFGTFPRGHSANMGNNSTTKITRDIRRTKNKLARKARKINW